jgi:SAM-dependent methyltransferase
VLNVIKNAIRDVLRSMGYEVRRIPRIPTALGYIPAAPALDPVWPLPRHAGGLSDQEIRDQFARFSLWHYGYEFDGGLSFLPKHMNSNSLTRNARRPLQRFRHFMPYLVKALGGTLGGKRILDIACNSGFWSIQCGLLGAEVVGFDARPELIDQAKLVKSIVGMDHVNFQVLSIEEMKPERLGRFDAVLNLGILYHLPDPLGALTATKAMTKSVIVVDTALWAVDEAVVHYNWEEPNDIRDAVTAGIVGFPSAAALELMLKHIGVATVYRIPLSTTDMPSDYLEGHRATWLITV